VIKPLIIWPATTLLGLFLCGLALGSLDTNYFGPFGLTLSAISSIATICIAARGVTEALEARKRWTEPEEDEPTEPMNFRSNVTPSGDRLKDLEAKLNELTARYRDLASHVEARFDMSLAVAMDAHERITAHEDLTLPELLAKHAGPVIAVATCSLAGTVAAFAPVLLHQSFQSLLLHAGALAKAVLG